MKAQLSSAYGGYLVRFNSNYNPLCSTLTVFCILLVKTGKYRAGDERKPGIVPPDEIFESFSTFIDSLLSDGDR